jgi:hypothetical protein
MDPNYIKEVDEIYRTIHIQSMRLKELQIEHTLFTWRWWVLFLLTVGPWLIWVIIRKKESTGRLLFAGFTLALAAIIFDMLGISYGLWSYRASLGLSVPPVVTWDLCLLPFFIMVFLQYKRDVNPYIKAAAFSVLGTFFWQPFGEWINVYHPIHWPHYYSFPVFFTMYLFAEYIYRQDYFER